MFVPRRGKLPLAMRAYGDQDALELSEAEVAAVIATVCADAEQVSQRGIANASMRLLQVTGSCTVKTG